MKYYVSRLSENRGQMQASTYNTSREDPGSDRSSVPSLVVKSEYIYGGKAPLLETLFSTCTYI